MNTVIQKAVRALKKRPIVALNYDVSTSVYRGKDASEPAAQSALRGKRKIDLVGLAVFLIAFDAFLRVAVYLLCRKEK